MGSNYQAVKDVAIGTSSDGNPNQSLRFGFCQRDCDGFTLFIISAQTDNAPIMEWGAIAAMVEDFLWCCMVILDGFRNFDWALQEMASHCLGFFQGFIQKLVMQHDLRL